MKVIAVSDTRKATSIIVLALSVSFAGSAAQSQTRIVSDELVSNLSCTSITAESIFKAVRPDAYAKPRQVLTENFFTRDKIGHCWALARWQRLALLLGRKTNGVITNSETIGEIISGNGAHAANPFRSSKFEVFFWRAPMSEQNVYDQKFDSPRPHGATYFNDLFASQRNLFFRPANLKFLYQRPTAEQNLKTALQISKLSNAKKLPLINIRRETSNQHVVVGISSRVISPTTVEFTTVDSNRPGLPYRIFLRRDKSENRFYAGIHPDSPGASPVDLFVVDEEERPKIEAALMKHYLKRCR